VKATHFAQQVPYKSVNARTEQPKCQGINFEPTAGLAKGKGTNKGTFMLVCHIGTIEKKVIKDKNKT
jgi:hypothetical protein